MRYLVIFAVWFFFGLTSITAQELRLDKPNDSAATWQLFKYDTNNTWKGIKHAVTRPLHWKKRDLTKFGGLLLGTVALSVTDEATSDFFRRQDNSFPQPIQEFGFYFGSPQNYLLANAGLYGFGLFTKNEKIRKTSVLIISSSITAGYIQILTRSVVGRGRPFADRGAYSFKFLASDGDLLSFPSGHTVFGITLSHSIAKQFKSPWTKAGIYTIGSIPSISRLIDGAHWLTDVTFSVFLSIAVVDSIDKFLFETKAYDFPEKKKNITWNFRFSGSQIGFVGTF